jgi:hypothetical protein
MSGESKRSDDPDFLDDDFVIEDLAGKQEDLEQLFTAPVVPVVPAPDQPPDSDDLLFTDHTEGLQPSESFSSNKTFGETTPSQWTDEGLDLESVGVPSAEAEVNAAAAAADVAAGETGKDIEPELREAEADFTAELGSLLQSEEEFGLDSDQELELVGGTTTDGVSEFEQSGPFVIDDGEGAWQQDDRAGATEPVSAAAADGADDDVAEPTEVGADDEALEPALAAADAEPVAEGWEPLPATSVDQLAEVGGVERNDGEPAAEPHAAPALVGAEVEGHDIYAEQPGMVLVGPRREPGRRRAVLFSLAASLALVGGAAALVMRPEWFGLAIEPDRVEQVQVERPLVKVTVPQPAPVGTPAAVVKPPRKPEPKPEPKTDPKTDPKPEPKPEPRTTTQPQNELPPATEPKPTTPAGDPSVGATVPPVGNQPELPLTDVAVTTSDPTSKPTSTIVAVPVGNDSGGSWPVASRDNPAAPAPKGASPLVRIGDDLMVGDLAPAGKPARVVDGVMPGSRAFAQLSNGNYFIGSVKFADAERVTLSVDEGEVTLATADLTRFTALGSADYEELQKATSGFVRLTNNNRLVGGILSRIADDHIVLEFRSNRVMLPKSAVGEVVRGVDDSGVRLDVTREEDDWVRQMVERQIGTGANPAETKPEPKPAAPAAVPAPTPARPAPPASGRR